MDKKQQQLIQIEQTKSVADSSNWGNWVRACVRASVHMHMADVNRANAQTKHTHIIMIWFDVMWCDMIWYMAIWISLADLCDGSLVNWVAS